MRERGNRGIFESHNYVDSCVYYLLFSFSPQTVVLRSKRLGRQLVQGISETKRQAFPFWLKAQKKGFTQPFSHNDKAPSAG